VDHLLDYIQDVKPDLVGLSLSVYFNLPSLKAGLDALRSDFRNLDIFVGGQAFCHGGIGLLKQYTGTCYVQSLTELDAMIRE